MLKLKEIIEYVVSTEEEAKEGMETFRQEAKTQGYILGSCGYTLKEKKVKGEIIDSKYVIKVIKIYGGVWD